MGPIKQNQENNVCDNCKKILEEEKREHCRKNHFEKGHTGKKDYFNKEYLTNALQRIFTKDMIQYHGLRLLALRVPTETNQKNFNEKKEYIKGHYNISDDELKELDERYDYRMNKQFYGISPF